MLIKHVRAPKFWCCLLRQRPQFKCLQIRGLGKFVSSIYSGSFPFRPQNVIRGIVQNTAVKPVSKLEIDIKVKIIGYNALQLILANRTRGDKIITLDKYMEKDKMTVGKNQSRIKWIILFFFHLLFFSNNGNSVLV